MNSSKLGPIYFDRLDERLIEVVNNEGSIELPELIKEYPEFAEVPSSTLWYRVNSLAQEGHIRAEHRRRNLILYSVEL
jgi:hypothetical protein